MAIYEEKNIRKTEKESTKDLLNLLKSCLCLLEWVSVLMSIGEPVRFDNKFLHDPESFLVHRTMKIMFTK